MENKEFIELLIKYHFYEEINKHITNTILRSFTLDDDILNIFNIYFVFENDGNCYITLIREQLLEKWKEKCLAQQLILLDGIEDEDKIKEIENDLTKIFNCGKESIFSDGKLEQLRELKDLVVIGDLSNNELFVVEKDRLIKRKYYNAVVGIRESIKRLFTDNDDSSTYKDVEFEKYINDDSQPNDKQEEIVKEGKNNNLIITGGPGTGKTTSICYLLLPILNEKEYELYLTAPSGKAASRIKESITDTITNNIKDKVAFDKDYEKAKAKLLNAKSYTIHDLLGHDFSTNDFKYNLKHQFKEQSVFIIDEASMIDVCLFNSLLQAIPDKARVFILGDKNQLPSVDAGAVFNDLYYESEKDGSFLNSHFIELDESIRFEKDTYIYKLAEEVNSDDGKVIETIPKEKIISLKDVETILKDESKPSKEKEVFKKDEAENKPVFLFTDESFEREKITKAEKNYIKSILESWGAKFYDNIETYCTDIDLDKKNWDNFFEYVDNAKVLCALNKGIRGVDQINNIIKNKIYVAGEDLDKKRKIIENCVPGLIMMITQNDKVLDLNNGDNGIIVKIKGDDTLYFMVDKKSTLYEREYDKDKTDRIFKKGKYLFYPLRMISKDIITLSYAITIHKSQGSGYNNIFVILPKQKQHPLLNRQIVYTAITRTKGITYIYSNLECLNEAKKNILKRDTGIFD